ncbi:unnamed protein product [Linum tenue]|uniref:Uncharacterized protein n=1 Tax=Linum tenue TaxID=586396 RepID=A0AAV0NJ21_9ROSI|nr:unnamed protein product [Linum tenue]
MVSPVFYPVFNRDRFPGDAEATAETILRSLSELLMDDRDQQSSYSSSSSEADELEGAPEGSYCVWTPKIISPSSVAGASPSPGRCEKSNSTGSSASTTKRRWRLRDLLRRSSSDGKPNTAGASSSGSNNSNSSNNEINLGKGVRRNRQPIGRRNRRRQELRKWRRRHTRCFIRRAER